MAMLAARSATPQRRCAARNSPWQQCCGSGLVAKRDPSPDRCGGRFGSVADTPETCQALHRMAFWETLRRFGKTWGGYGRLPGSGERRGARRVWCGRLFASYWFNLLPWHRGRLNDSWMAAMREYGSIGASDPNRPVEAKWLSGGFRLMAAARLIQATVYIRPQATGQPF